jgi:hypothetical protein
MSGKNGFIGIKGQDMVVDGKPILLKGAGLGGWSESPGIYWDGPS